MDVLEELGRSFKGAMAAVRRLRGRDTHHPGELSYAQYGLLFGLAGGEVLSSRELALSADVSPATVTQMLESLAAAGLVQRVRCEQDKRIVLTSLTEHGRALVQQRRARFEERWRAALADFSDEQLAAAAAVLDRLHTYFDELADQSLPADAPAPELEAGEPALATAVPKTRARVPATATPKITVR